jgi:hypothetical protein
MNLLRNTKKHHSVSPQLSKNCLKLQLQYQHCDSAPLDANAYRTSHSHLLTALRCMTSYLSISV